MAALAERVGDWDRVLEIARQHRVLPLLAGRMAGIRDSVPARAGEELDAEFRRNAFQSMANAAELITILRLFESEGIAAMPFKGVVLGASAYHDLTSRPAGDLDILLRRNDLFAAARLLESRGFRIVTELRDDGSPVVDGYYEYHLERAADGMIVELRWRLELPGRRFHRELGLDWVWPSRQTALLAGASVPKVAPELMLLVLCMHGSKHVWSRLIWICDVGRHLASSPDLDWEAVLRVARRAGLMRPVALGVLLAQALTGAEVPAAVLGRFGSDRLMERFAGEIGENLFDAPGQAPQASVPYGVCLLSRQDRMRMLVSLESLRPNDRDRAFLRLPRALDPLYYVVRPLRLLLDRSARL